MEVQLEDLINRIKDEGIKTAEQKSAELIADAEKKAHALLDNARAEAESLIKKGEADAARREATGREALKQAARDTLIALRTEIGRHLDALLREEASKALKGDSLKEAILSVLRNWKPDQAGQLALVIPESEAKNLESALKTALAAEMRGGLELKVSPELKAGFRVSGKNGEWFYDFTDEELTAVLSRYLSASLVKIVSE